MSELLTKKENELLNLSAELWNGFIDLPLLHPAERREFEDAVHRAQAIIMQRAVLRDIETGGAG